MEIKTKFNVGDKVWIIEFIAGTKYIKEKAIPTKVWFVSYEDVEIKGFTIMQLENGETGIFVNLKSTNLGFLESECFSTKEEAQKECEKRNGKK